MYMMVSLSAVSEMVKGGMCTSGRFQVLQYIISSCLSAVTCIECAAKEVLHSDIIVVSPFGRRLPCRMVLAQARHIFSVKLQQGWLVIPTSRLLLCTSSSSFMSIVTLKRVHKLQGTQNPGISLLA